MTTDREVEIALNIFNGATLCMRCLGKGRYEKWQTIHGHNQCHVCTGRGYYKGPLRIRYTPCNREETCSRCNENKRKLKDQS